jgi:hypothetical protein
MLAEHAVGRASRDRRVGYFFQVSILLLFLTYMYIALCRIHIVIMDSLFDNVPACFLLYCTACLSFLRLEVGIFRLFPNELQNRTQNFAFSYPSHLLWEALL